MAEGRDQGRSGKENGASGKQRRYDPLVQVEFERLVADNPRTSLMGIYKMLERVPFPEHTKLPVPRTLRNHYRDLHPPDHSGTWQMSDSDAEDIPVITATIAELNRRSGVTNVTFAEAKWLSTLRVQTADLKIWPRWRLAWLCRIREAGGAPMEDLVLFVGYAPWRSSEAAAEYQAAITSGRVPQAPALVYADIETLTYSTLAGMTYAELSELWSTDAPSAG